MEVGSYPKAIKTQVGATNQTVWFAWVSETEMLRDKRGVGRRFKSEAAARDALTLFMQGAREGWMRCGAFHIDIDFEGRESEKAEINRRWPLPAQN